ncbi:MAG: hypothetical protein Q9M92_00135 [Enterobacterales bacterium]|nr:hypothetical protein [Enterobacterales bacterium]
MQKHLKIFVFVCLFSTQAASVTAGEIAVIANKDLSINSLNIKQVKKLWLSKIKKVGDSGNLVPVDVDPSSANYSAFYKKVAKKNPAQIKLYWSKQMFSGKNFPAKRLSDDDSIIEWVSSNKNAIGYISADKVTDSVKVLGTF